MNKKLKHCWCGKFPDLMHYTENGRAHISYMCDQTIDEHQPHAMMADDAESEEKARQNWNRMMDAIESHYSRRLLKIKYSEAKYIVNEIRRLVIEKRLCEQTLLFEFVKGKKEVMNKIINFWWKSSTLRTSIKRILKGGNNE